MFFGKKIKNIVGILGLTSICALFGGSSVEAAPVQKTVKIVFVGDKFSGKTAFRSALIGKTFDFDSRANTLRSDLYTQLVPYDENTTLVCELWDTSGDPTVKQQILNYRARDAKFVALAIDLSPDAERSYDSILKQNMAEWTCDINKAVSDVNIIFLGTKSDLITPQAQRELESKLDHWTGLYDNTRYVLTSAKKNINIDRFFEIVKEVIRTKNLINSLPEWSQTSTASGASDDASTANTSSSESSGICVLL